VETLTDPHGSAVFSVAFSSYGRTLATSDLYGITYLWDVPTGHLIATRTDPRSAGIYSVAFSPDGRMLATGDGNGHIYLWDASPMSR